MKASFQCSRSPLYRLFCILRVMLLYMYNQHDRSGSTNFTGVLFLTVFYDPVLFYFSGEVLSVCVFVVSFSGSIFSF